MTQVLRDLGVEYVALESRIEFRRIAGIDHQLRQSTEQNAGVHYGLHEESAVTMAHGYGKAEGKPMCALLHATIGIQHAAMSIYQAYYDRAPVLILVGRDEGFIAAHTAHDMAGMVRSFTKWDAQPKTLEESLTAIQRAYNEAITPPCASDSRRAGYRASKRRSQDDEGAGVSGHRESAASSRTQATRDREGIGRRAKSQNCRRASANAARSEDCGRTCGTGRCIHQHGCDEWPDEFPATSSALRSRIQYHL